MSDKIFEATNALGLGPAPGLGGWGPELPFQLRRRFLGGWGPELPFQVRRRFLGAGAGVLVLLAGVAPPVSWLHVSVGLVLLVAAAIVAGQLAVDWITPRKRNRGPVHLRLIPAPEGSCDLQDGLGADEQLHEMRASLAGVLSAVELLARRGEVLPPARRSQLAHLLDEELHRLGRMLEGDSSADEGPCLVDEALEPIVASRRLAGQDVSWEPNGEWALVGSDPLAEMVNILLVNAEVHAPGSRVHVDVAVHDAEVHVCVRDDGPGIPPALLTHVFGAGVRDVASPGSGLGLAVARRLALEAGGDLVALNVARGAAFELRFRATVRTRQLA